MPVLFYGVFMKINIHEFDKDNRLFTALGLNAKFFPQLQRTFNETEKFLDNLSIWGIVPRAIRYKSILNYDCIVLVGRIANNNGELFVLDKCANPYVEIAKHAEIPFISVAINANSEEFDLDLLKESYHYKQPIVDVAFLGDKLKEIGMTKKSKVLLLNTNPNILTDSEMQIGIATYKVLKEFK